MPEAVLDVVVGGPLTSAEPSSAVTNEQRDSMQAPPPAYDEGSGTAIADDTLQETTFVTIASATSSVRRNPAYGLENVATENYTHIDRPPPVSPSARTPQSLSTAIPPASNKASQIQRIDSNHPSNIPQESSAAIATTDFTQTMNNADHGDMWAQVALGAMYRKVEMSIKTIKPPWSGTARHPIKVTPRPSAT